MTNVVVVVCGVVVALEERVVAIWVVVEPSGFVVTVAMVEVELVNCPVEENCWVVLFSTVVP